MSAEAASYGERQRRLLGTLLSDPVPEGARIGLNKKTSNLFRARREGAKHRLDLSGFNHVLGVDRVAGTVQVEGLATYEDIVAGTLPYGAMPAVVPQLKTITAGGAVAGVGIEATSFRQGLVHHTLLEFDVLLPGGEIVTCTPTNAYRDLFFGFPNSYGSLGYALRLVLRILPVKPCVRVEHIPFDTAAGFFSALADACEGDPDFVDGVVFSPGTFVLNVARFEEVGGPLSRYDFEQIYYRSLLERPVDHLSVQDYLWRWDTDWFWCSKNFGAQNPVVRRLFGRSHLNSKTYSRLMRISARLRLTQRIARLSGMFAESVIQDVDIPVASAVGFLDFLQREIGIHPVWICPVHAPDSSANSTLYPLRAGQLYINFGFWDVVKTRQAKEPGHFNRLIEQEVLRLCGIKSLYSDCYFSRDEFGHAYDMPRYDALKLRYDPKRLAPHLYDKCVMGR